MQISRALALVASLCFAVFMLAAQPATAQQSEAQAQPSQPSGPAVAEGASSDYVLGRDDVVEVGLIGRGDFGGRARVQADGTIQLPLIGKVAAADHTTSELAETIRKALLTGGYFADPVVNVEVVGYASRYVTVLGAVGSPGLVPINRPYRLSEIMARVGGVREGGADYVSVRSANGDERRILLRDLAAGGPDQDPYVAPGDKIYVPTAETYYIYGQVNSPGAYALTSNMTVRQAIAKGGGLTESGSDKKVTVTRDGKKTKLDLSDTLLPNDVIVIGERLF